MLILTVYDSNNWIETFLTPAIEAEKKGIGILYFDEEKASKYGALSKKKGSIPTGFVHNIAQRFLCSDECICAATKNMTKFFDHT